LDRQHEPGGVRKTPAELSTSPRPAMAAARRDDVLSLQRLAGNRAVVRSLPISIQRDDDQRPRPALAQTALLRSQDIRAAATVRLGKIAAYNAAADVAIGSYRDMRTRYAVRWGAAWDRHNGKLAEGNEEASSQNLIEGIVIGAAAAVVITAAATVAFPVRLRPKRSRLRGGPSTSGPTLLVALSARALALLLDALVSVARRMVDGTPRLTLGNGSHTLSERLDPLHH
jgi:hypothetical protein